MDFTLKKVVNVKSHWTACGVVQEFEYYINRPFKRHFSEMEVVLLSYGAGTTAYFQLAREERATKELFVRQLDVQENKLTLQYRHSEMPSAESIIHQIQNILGGKR
jgi:sporulation-control protein spo0M